MRLSHIGRRVWSSSIGIGSGCRSGSGSGSASARARASANSKASGCDGIGIGSSSSICIYNISDKNMRRQYPEYRQLQLWQAQKYLLLQSGTREGYKRHLSQESYGFERRVDIQCFHNILQSQYQHRMKKSLPVYCTPNAYTNNPLVQNQEKVQGSIRRLNTATAASATKGASVPNAINVETTTWIERYVPGSIQPYMYLARIEKPIGTWLLLWPCLWSTVLASAAGQAPNLALLSLFSVGAFAMRGAGCTINDLWDKDFDSQVERTRTRPLAAGTVTVHKALLFLFAQLSIGLLVVVNLNMYSILWSFASIPIVVAYPLMKRVTNWPQLVLGCAFNWGAIVGWAAVQGQIFAPAVLPLYVAGITWTLVYDTIYAHQDAADDKIVGIKSTALHFGNRSKLIMSVFAAISVGCLMLAGYGTNMSLLYYLISCLGAAICYLIQLLKVDLTNRPSCLHYFKFNKYLGLAVFLGILLDKLFPIPLQDSFVAKEKVMPQDSQAVLPSWRTKTGIDFVKYYLFT